jgi:ubiquinol-cytochrome c reductase cytochrome b subunit
VITRWLVRRVDDRLGFSPLAKKGLNKVFPDHWTFMIGEIALYSFIYLLISGTYLTFFFENSTVKTVYHGAYAALDGSSVSAAYASTVALSWDVRLGLVMRQSHHWAALIFCGAIVVHMCRIFFTGAFRKPRDINWLVGVTLMLLAFVNDFAGYSLPDDLLSGTGLRVANAIMLSIPVIGSWLSFLVFGGEFPGEDIIQRLYVAHILLVPALILALIAVHMIILVKQKHSQFPGPGRTDTNVVGSRLWPSYAVRSIGLLAAVFSACLLLGGLVQINPIWLWGPFEPGSTVSPAQPDFPVGWVDGALRMWVPWEPVIFGWKLPTVFLPGALLPGVTFLILYLYPWIERRFTRDRLAHQVIQRPRDVPGRTAFGVWALTFVFMCLAAFSDDVISRYTGIPVYVLLAIFQVATCVLPFVTALIAFVLARALRDSEAEALMQLTWKDLTSSLRRSKPPPEEPPEPEADDERRSRSQPMPDDTVLEHLPVETGPVP